MRRTTTRCLGVLALAAPLAVGCSTTTKTEVVGGTPVPSSRPSAAGAPSTGAANPVGKLSAADIVARSRTVALAAAGAHLTGSGTDSGQHITLNVTTGSAAAASGTGTIVIAGGPLQLIDLGATVYVRSTPDGWRKVAVATGQGAATGEQIATTVGTRWVKAPATGSDFAAFTSFVTLRELVTKVLPTADDARQLENRGVSTVAGKQVVTLADRFGPSRWTFAATGNLYPLSRTDSSGVLRFDTWNVPLRVEAPPAADVIAVPGS